MGSITYELVTEHGAFLAVISEDAESGLFHGKISGHGIEAWGEDAEAVLRKLGHRASFAVDEVA
jgi:hypothetical protein